MGDSRTVSGGGDTLLSVGEGRSLRVGEGGPTEKKDQYHRRESSDRETPETYRREGGVVRDRVNVDTPDVDSCLVPALGVRISDNSSFKFTF